MLLRSSRAAEQLDKLAGIGGKILGGLEKLGPKFRAAKDWGKAHWKPLGATALVGAATVPMAVSGHQRAQQGMSGQNYGARMAGYQHAGLPKAPSV
jgi:hypothetical protein